MKTINKSLTAMLCIFSLSGVIYADEYKPVSLKEAERLSCQNRFVMNTDGSGEKTYVFSDSDPNRELVMGVSKRGKKIGEMEYVASNIYGYMVFRDKEDRGFQLNIGNELEGDKGGAVYSAWYIDKRMEKATKMICVPLKKR